MNKTVLQILNVERCRKKSRNVRLWDNSERGTRPNISEINDIEVVGGFWKWNTAICKELRIVNTERGQGFPARQANATCLAFLAYSEIGSEIPPGKILFFRNYRTCTNIPLLYKAYSRALIGWMSYVGCMQHRSFNKHNESCQCEVRAVAITSRFAFMVHDSW